MLSTDAGKSWSVHLDSFAHSYRIAWPSTDTIYNLTFEKELVRSTDAGRSWQHLKSIDVDNLPMDFVNSREGFVGVTRDQLLRSADAGETWTQINYADSMQYLRCFGDTLIVASRGLKISVSTNSGETWQHTPLPNTLSQVHDIIRTPSGAWVAIGGGSYARRVLYSTDQGATWTLSTFTNPSSFAHFLDGEFTDEMGIAAGFFGAIAISTDEGRSWEEQAASSLHDPIIASAVGGIDVGESGRIYAPSGRDRIRVSTDAGLTWEERKSTGSAQSFRFVFEYSPNILIAGGLDHAIARSGDGGESWQRDSLMPHIGYSAILKRGNTMLLSGSQYIFASSDSGLTWAPIDTLPQAINGMIHLPSGKIALVGSQGSSKGTSFFALSDPDGKNFDITVFDTVNGLFSITSLGGDSLVAPGRDGTFLLSTDLGETWVRKNTGFTTVTHKIAYVSDSLMVAATGLGVLESYDRGKTWHKIEIPNLRRIQGADPNYLGVLDVEVAPSGLVYAAGGDLIFVRGLTPGTSAVAKVENSTRKNIYLRVMPYPNPATEGSAKVTILGAPTIRGVRRTLAVVDVLGRKVIDLSTQANRDLSSPSLEVEFSTRDLAKGTYLIVLDADGTRISEQLLVR